MASRFNARLDIALLKYDGERGPAFEAFLKNVALFMLEDQRLSETPLTGSQLLQYIILQATPRRPFSQYLNRSKEESIRHLGRQRGYIRVA